MLFLKKIAYFIVATTVVITIGIYFNDSIGNSISGINNFIVKDINDNGGIKKHLIEFKYINESIFVDIFNNTSEYVPIKKSYLQNDLFNFYILPFAVLIGFLSLVKSEKKFAIVLISILLFLIYSEARLFIQIVDHCNRIPLEENGRIISVLFQPNYYDYLVQAINETLTLRSAIYTRFLIVILCVFIPFYYFEKEQVNRIFRFGKH